MSLIGENGAGKSTMINAILDLINKDSGTVTFWGDELMDKFKIPLNTEIQKLSKGMVMKFSIALALSHKPKLLILDEATSGLDPVMRDDINVIA